MIKTKADLKYYIDEDNKNNNFRNGFKSWFGNDIKSFLKYLRHHEYLLNSSQSILKIPLNLYVYYKYKVVSKRLGFSIPPNVCGPGLKLPHYGNIVINRKCKIGANCKIHVGVNIGAALNNSDATPVLGDNCYIAPGAKIFGAIKLGDFSQIGANAVVNKSFPESGHVLVGIPARSIRKVGERVDFQKEG